MPPAASKLCRVSRANSSIRSPACAAVVIVQARKRSGHACVRDRLPDIITKYVVRVNEKIRTAVTAVILSRLAIRIAPQTQRVQTSWHDSRKWRNLKLPPCYRLGVAAQYNCGYRCMLRSPVLKSKTSLQKSLPWPLPGLGGHGERNTPAPKRAQRKSGQSEV